MGNCCHSREEAVRNEEPEVHFSNVQEQTTVNPVAEGSFQLQLKNKLLPNSMGQFGNSSELTSEDDRPVKENGVNSIKVPARREDSAVHFSNTQQELATDKRIAIALFPFQSNNSLLLNFEKGDQLLIKDDSDPGWYVARHINKERKAFVPKSYLSVDGFGGEESWFFGDTNREDAERLLLQPENKPGAFLVRRSNAQGSYSLSIKHINSDTNEVVLHYRIRTLDDGRFFIDATKSFDTLKDLVMYYSNDTYGLCAKLEHTCRRPRPRILDPLPNSSKDEIPFESLKFVASLGKGKFGEVFYGLWNDVVDVAIKRFVSIGILRREVAVMKAHHHPKIVRLFAVCTEKKPFCIVMEYMCNGNLQQYLKTEQGKKLRLHSLADISAQIADGMMFLEANRMIHGDLSTRNILVGEGGAVKLAGFGLARILDEAVYSEDGGNLHKERKTPEIFTIKSDALAFGMVLYNIFTHGKSPYSDMKTAQISQLLTKQDYRLPKPSESECTDAVYEIITKCWKKDPEDRPTFEFLYHFFADFPVTSEALKREAMYGI